MTDQVMADPLLKVKAAAMKAMGEPTSAARTKEVEMSADPRSMRVFPGLDGIPFRQKPGQQTPMLKQDDPEFMQPKMIADAHVRLFNMSKPEDLREYEAVWDKAAKGLVLISSEKDHWSDKEQTFLILLRWGELYLELSKEGADAHRSFK